MLISTYDLEEWWHVVPCPVPRSEWDEKPRRVRSLTESFLDLLDSLERKATFFVVGWIAQKEPGLVREICARGHEIGCHSMWHESVIEIGAKRFQEDVSMAKAVLEDVVGEAVDCYRAPSFTITPDSRWAFHILVEEGFHSDASISRGLRVLGGGFEGLPCDRPFTLDVAGAPLRCFPMSSWRFFGKELTITGGGYLRVAPASLLRYIVRQQDYVMTYIHPSDFDRMRPSLDTDSAFDRLRRTVQIGDLWQKVRMMHLLGPSRSIGE